MPSETATSVGVKKPSICVIGSGVTGLTLCHFLGDEYDVTLLESHPMVGIDSASVDYAGGRIDVPLRTFTEEYYPNLSRVYREVGVVFEEADYSFQVAELDGSSTPSTPHFGFVNRDPISVFLGIYGGARPKVSIWNFPRFYSLIREYWSFLAKGRRDLDDPNSRLHSQKFETYVLESFSRRLYVELLLPMLSVVCTCSFEAVGNFPAEILVDYMTGRIDVNPHGNVTRRAINGTRDVAERLSRKCKKLVTSACATNVTPASASNPKTIVTYNAEGVETREEFDFVCVCTPAGPALSLLGEHASEMHRAALGRLPYERNRTVLHTDTSVFQREGSTAQLLVDVKRFRSDCTIWMNNIDPRLKKALSHDVYQTWNPLCEPRKESIVLDVEFERPVMTCESAQALELLRMVQGQGNIYFAGAYSLYSMCLLENGVRSSIRVANTLLALRGAPLVEELGEQITGQAFRARNPHLIVERKESRPSSAFDASKSSNLGNVGPGTASARVLLLTGFTWAVLIGASKALLRVGPA